jgi:hypothetical protein
MVSEERPFFWGRVSKDAICHERSGSLVGAAVFSGRVSKDDLPEAASGHVLRDGR